MQYLTWIIGIGATLGIITWQILIWLGEIRDKREKYQRALSYARNCGKPLLIAGGPYGSQKLRRFFRIAAHGGGDVCLDIDRDAVADHSQPVVASVTHIPFGDRVFGAVFASHLLEHLPSIEDARQALNELSRTADAVFITSPSRQSLSGWLHPDHHLWVWEKGGKTFVEERRRRGKKVREVYNLNNAEPASQLRQEAILLGQELFGRRNKKAAVLADHLVNVCAQAKEKEFLLIHNPGGWGSTPLDELLDWESSIVEGVSNTIKGMGYSCVLVQFFRSGCSFWAHTFDMKEQLKFLFRGQMRKSAVLAAELRFISRHSKGLKIVLIGASQGAAFSNAVMRQIGDLTQVYSIELGLFFPHMGRRVITERTLAIDDNGIMPDPMAHRDLWVGFKAYLTAPSRYIKCRLDGHPQKFTSCVNAPGHDYNWHYLAVRRRIEDFLMAKFGAKKHVEVGVK